MKKKRHKTKQKPLSIKYDRAHHGWIVVGSGNPRIFATQCDIENYCVQKLGCFPVCLTPPKEEYQQLPRTSVWTGAPWDKTFQNVIK
jgi:hypothetical protein